MWGKTRIKTERIKIERIKTHRYRYIGVGAPPWDADGLDPGNYHLARQKGGKIRHISTTSIQVFARYFTNVIRFSITIKPCKINIVNKI